MEIVVDVLIGYTAATLAVLLAFILNFFILQWCSGLNLKWLSRTLKKADDFFWDHVFMLAMLPLLGAVVTDIVVTTFLL